MSKSSSNSNVLRIEAVCVKSDYLNDWEGQSFAVCMSFSSLDWNFTNCKKNEINK